MILPHKKFQEEEYEVTVAILSKASMEVCVASSQKNAEGIYGATVVANLALEGIDIMKFDAVVLIGGVGSIEHWHNKKIFDLLIEANNLNKLICAICLAPVTLANAGLLENKKATAYDSAASYLRSKGAIYTGRPVEISDNIITARCPEASKGFARAIVDSLTGLKSN
jgi:protease I